MSAFSNSAIWMRLSHFENKLAFRAFWRTEREKNSSHWPRHIKACFPSPTATWKKSKNLLKFTSFYCWKNAWVLTPCQYHIMIVSINGRNHTIEKFKEPLGITSQDVRTSYWLSLCWDFDLDWVWCNQSKYCSELHSSVSSHLPQKRRKLTCVGHPTFPTSAQQDQRPALVTERGPAAL